MPAPETDQTRWFALEVQPHETALRAYLRVRFPKLGEPDDVVQETYVRVLNEQRAGRLRHARAFLFTAARNVALDFFRRRKTAAIDAVPHSELANVVEEKPSAAETLSQQQELEALGEAVQTLPERCRQVVMLRYLKGYSYKQIADVLGVSVETVKTHMAKGVQRCSEHFAARGLLREHSHDAPPRAD